MQRSPFCRCTSPDDVLYAIPWMTWIFHNSIIFVNTIGQQCIYRSEYGTAAVLLIGFAIKWWHNQVTRQSLFRDLIHILMLMPLYRNKNAMYYFQICRLLSAHSSAIFLIIVAESNMTFGISEEAIAKGLCYNSSGHPTAGERTKVMSTESSPVYMSNTKCPACLWKYRVVIPRNTNDIQSSGTRIRHTCSKRAVYLLF